MNKILILSVLNIIVSCTLNVKGQDLKSEKELCSQWSNHYDCKCDCSIVNENGKKVLSMTLSNGNNLNLLDSDVISSRVALTNYQYYKDSTSKGYNEYQIIVINPESLDSVKFNYTPEQLSLLETKTKICENYLYLLAENKIEELPSYFAPEVFEKTSEKEIKETFKQLDDVYGKLISANILGFSQPKEKVINDKKVRLFQLKVVMIREKENINLTFIMNLDPNDSGIYGFK